MVVTAIFNLTKAEICLILLNITYSTSRFPETIECNTVSTIIFYDEFCRLMHENKIKRFDECLWHLNFI